MTFPKRYAYTILTVGVIGPAPVTAQDPGPVALTVRVVDAATGTPLQGAVVQLSGAVERHVTDEAGRATFHATPGSYFLTARRSGYEPLEGDFRVARAGSFTLRMVARPTEDPSAPGRLVGTVVETGSSRPVPGAALTVPGLGQFLTDEDGRFEVPGVPPGLIRIDVSGLGYAARSEAVTVQAGRSTVLTIGMAVDPLELEPIDVEVRSAFLEAQGVYRRMEGGRSGRILTRAELERRDSYRLSDSLNRIPGLLVERRNKRSVLLGRGRCLLRIFVDGVMVGPEMDGTVDIDLFPPEWIEVAEVYVGISSVPVEFADTGEDCGVLLLWSRRRAG